MATPQHSTYNTEPITWFPGVQNIGKQDGSKSNDKKQTTTTTTKKKKKKKKSKEPKISKKKAKKVQKKEKKRKETEEEEVVTGKIELEHLAPGMSIEIDSGDPEDPWWGEIVRLKKSDASIESKDEDEVEITWIVKNSKGKYEYLKEKGGRGRQNDIAAKIPPDVADRCQFVHLRWESWNAPKNTFRCETGRLPQHRCAVVAYPVVIRC